MYYLKSRFYDPELCRFINADAYTDTGTGVIGTNMFAYCDNNPVMFTDPSGFGPASLAPFFKALGTYAALISAFSLLGKDPVFPNITGRLIDTNCYTKIFYMNAFEAFTLRSLPKVAVSLAFALFASTALGASIISSITLFLTNIGISSVIAGGLVAVIFNEIFRVPGIFSDVKKGVYTFWMFGFIEENPSNYEYLLHNILVLTGPILSSFKWSIYPKPSNGGL